MIEGKVFYKLKEISERRNPILRFFLIGRQEGQYEKENENHKIMYEIVYSKESDQVDV